MRTPLVIPARRPAVRGALAIALGLLASASAGPAVASAVGAAAARPAQAAAGPETTRAAGDPRSPGLGQAPLELVIESRTLVNDGATFGRVGQYERLRGYAAGELDPRFRANAGIVNLDKAPRNENGKVEYRVDVEIHRPLDAAAANGTLLYEVVNRGNKLLPAYVSGSDALPYAEGFTMVWSGWQGEIPRVGENLIASLPVAVEDDGSPIVGTNRDEFVDRGTGTWTGTLTYPAATTDRRRATLTVRQREQDARTPVAGWRYVDDRTIEVTHPGAPFDAGAIFEFIYPARDPIVAGIGFAATRDLLSLLRFYDEDRSGTQNPLEPQLVQHTLAMGVSQSGRYLRDFLYQGFNADLAGRQLFDGMMPIIAGSRKTWVNEEFAQPGRWSKQHEEHLQPGDQFPFAYNTVRDPLTGQTDGVLAACDASDTCPKVMHVDGEFEVWGARGSLVRTTPTRRPRDLDLPANVRLYMVAGTPHGGANTIVPTTTDRGICQQVNTPLGSSAVVRSMLLQLEDWVSEGWTPPESRYGSADDRTLVPPDRRSTGFPRIPGVTYTGLVNPLRVTDYSQQPPREGRRYTVLVPRVDRDGNSLAGIRLPALEAPIATYTGWNLRAAGHAEGEMCGASGSYIPFAKTRTERLIGGDPRLSVEERYRSKNDYLRSFDRAADELVRHGYLLPQDADTMVAQAEALDIGLDDRP